MSKKINTIHTGIEGELFVKHHIVQNYPEYNVYVPLIDERGCDLIIERRKKNFESTSKDNNRYENRNSDRG